MESLDVTDHFDVHDYRHGLKLLEQTRQTMHLANRDGFACPACGEEFDRLFVSEKRTNTFGSPTSPFCLVRTDDQLLIVTH